MTELKPCPNPECENPDVYLDDARETNGSGILFSCCDKCGFRGPNVEFVPGRLEDAETEAARLHNAMPREEPWIPVTERLPEDGARIELWLTDCELPDLHVVELQKEWLCAFPIHHFEHGALAFLAMAPGALWRPYREPRRP